MFGYISKQKHNEAMDGLREIAAELRRTIELREIVIRKVQSERDDARSDRDIALRRAAHADAEVAQLTKDIAGLLPDAEKHRARKARQTKNLRQFRSAHPVASAIDPRQDFNHPLHDVVCGWCGEEHTPDNPAH